MAEYSIFRHDIPELLSLMFAVHTLQDALLSHHEGHIINCIISLLILFLLFVL